MKNCYIKQLCLAYPTEFHINSPNLIRKLRLNVLVGDEELLPLKRTPPKPTGGGSSRASGPRHLGKPNVSRCAKELENSQ